MGLNKLMIRICRHNWLWGYSGTPPPPKKKEIGEQHHTFFLKKIQPKTVLKTNNFITLNELPEFEKLTPLTPIQEIVTPSSVLKIRFQTSEHLDKISTKL